MPFCEHCGAKDAGNYCGDCGRPQPGHKPRSDVDYDALDKDVRSHSHNPDEVIFEGTTWPWLCCSPMCCRTTKWKITRRRIDFSWGCCGSHSDTLDLRRIKDMSLRSNIFQRCCCGRGTVHFYASSQISGNDDIQLTHSHAKDIYKAVRSAWSDGKLARSAGGEDDKK